MKIPHIIQYQGSKRKLAAQILQYAPKKFERLVEPFSGMAALSIAAAFEGRTNSYLINDLNAPLVGILQEAVENPAALSDDYKKIWSEQFAYGDNHAQHFYKIRDRFNSGIKTPANLLYLLARCVKGSVRYGKNGNFNQSPDKRRHGTNPQTLKKNLYAVSALLKGKAKFSAADYRTVLKTITVGDLIYMDPPYQGVSDTRDNRYCSGLNFEEFVDTLRILNGKGVDYLVSYDGACGEKIYGCDLPADLGCKKILLYAGTSAQSTLLGKSNKTFESLYISKSLLKS